MSSVSDPSPVPQAVRYPFRSLMSVVVAWVLAVYASLALVGPFLTDIVLGLVALAASWVAVFLAWRWMGPGILRWVAAVAAGWLTFQVTVWAFFHFT